MFGLVDCNNFYASCERVFRPDLEGKSIAILSNNDGCVIARSGEAKLLGLPMGAPAFKYEQFFKEKKIHVFSSNYPLYGDMSNRVMNILADMAPEIEIYSIDEAFLKYTNCDYLDLQSHAVEMRKRVVKGTGIPVSVGFAETKALSKVANKISKKFTDKTGGVYIIDSDEKRIKALKWTKIEDVWGVGGKLTKRFKLIGVHTAYDFTQLTDEYVRNQMSVVEVRLKKELEGKPMLDLDEVKRKKNIAITRSFDKIYIDYEQIKERIVTFAVTCSEKLRKQQSCCNSLLVFVKTSRHRKDDSQYYNSVVMQLPYPTSSSIELAKFATQGLKKIFRKGYRYKKAGVIVMDFVPEDQYQMSLFENANPKHKQLMKAIDLINHTIGSDKIKLAGQDLQKTWKMKQEKLSPRYTTKLNEIIDIKS